MRRLTGGAWLAGTAFLWMILSAAGSCASAPKPLDVEDLVRYATIGNPQILDWHGQTELAPEPAAFSPEGKYLGVVIRRGNTAAGTNDGILHVYLTSDLLRDPRPLRVVKFSSATNYQPLAQVRWLDDDRLILAGTAGTRLSQIYRFDIGTGTLDTLTHLSRQLLWYDVTRDGGRIVALTERPAHPPAESSACTRGGCRVTADRFYYHERGIAPGSAPFTVIEMNGGQATELPAPENEDDSIESCDPRLEGGLSPDGRFALRMCRLKSLPAWWGEYTADPQLARCVASGNRRCFRRVVLIDLERSRVSTLTEAPYIPFRAIPVWTRENHVLLPRGLESLIGVEGDERVERARSFRPLLIDPLTRETQHVSAQVADEIVRQSSKGADSPMTVRIAQSLNDPPRLIVQDRNTGIERVILDPNEWLRGRALGRAAELSWTTRDGRPWRGVLYYPAAYMRATRYPLVIQTHGFEPNHFSLTGYAQNFAGRALAARGIAVLQVAENEGELAGTPAVWSAVQAGYEGAIDHLDRMGFIDRSRVGIQGWSGTGPMVAYTLTHSAYSFAAGTLTATADYGWLYYLISGAERDVEATFGAAPFGTGLDAWAEYSGAFNLQCARTPMLMWANGTALGLWDWYAGLRRLGKPVELWESPESTHDVLQVNHRMLLGQLLVDWFSFWLKNETDSNPAKAAQYARWQMLREQQVRPHQNTQRRSATRYGCY